MPERQQVMDWRRGRDEWPSVKTEQVALGWPRRPDPSNRTSTLHQRRLIAPFDLGRADQRETGRGIGASDGICPAERAQSLLLGVAGVLPWRRRGPSWAPMGCRCPSKAPPCQLGGYGSSGAELSGGVSGLISSFANPNTRDFDWEPGRPYRLRILRAADGWAGSLDGAIVRCLDAPGQTLQSPMMWSEVFADCDHPAVSVRWSELEVVTRSGRRVPVTSAVTSYQSRQDGGCDNTNSRSDRHAFVQMTNVVRTPPRGARLQVD